MATINDPKRVEEKNDGNNWTTIFYSKKVDIKKLSNEFKILQKEKEPAAQEMQKYPKFCRYTNIICIDATRVVLKNWTSDFTFIHANDMVMPNGQRFVATQGPMDNTVQHFLHMVIIEKVVVIVQLCRFVEDGKIKSERYIPSNNDTLFFGPYGIRKSGDVHSTIDGVFTTKFEIIDKKSGNVLTKGVHHHYTEWEDHKCPERLASTLRLLDLAKKEAKGGPIVTHCSAGAGRTGVFVGLEFGFQRLKQDPNLKPIQILREMRQKRAKCVQSQYQFIFLILGWTALSLPKSEKNNNVKMFLKQYQQKMLDNQKKAEENKK